MSPVRDPKSEETTNMHKHLSVQLFAKLSEEEVLRESTIGSLHTNHQAAARVKRKKSLKLNLSLNKKRKRILYKIILLPLLNFRLLNA